MSAALDAMDVETAAPATAPFIVVPGQDVTEHITSTLSAMTASASASTTVKLGAGLLQARQQVLVTKAGVLEFKKPNRFYVNASGKRYAPAVGDTVIGIVTDKTADFYRIKLNSTTAAILPTLAFDGASKRNKPNLAIGAPVFGRIAACSKFMETELSCQALSGPKKDWMTGESLFGELRGGTLIKCSLSLCRSLLDPECPILLALGAALPFEIAVGLNGLVYAQANSVPHTVAICNAIERSEALSAAQCKILVDKIVSVLS